MSFEIRSAFSVTARAIATGSMYRHLFHDAGKFCENQLKACRLSASIRRGSVNNSDAVGKINNLCHCTLCTQDKCKHTEIQTLGRGYIFVVL